MMTVAKLSAGDGYAYYIQQTVSADVEREPGQKLVDYYAATGSPAGVWMGSGIDTLGLTGEVTEEQMKALYGQGRHPDAVARLAALENAGVPKVKRDKAVSLGGVYRTYSTPSGELAQRIAQAISAREERKGSTLDDGERRETRMKTAAIAYRERYGKSAQSPKELTQWMRQELASGKQAVAGFDLTFSAPKSVSVLWACADEDTSALIEQAHEKAQQEALAYLESHAVQARVGKNGVRSVAVEGLVASRFRHWTSREGDPQLHDHVVISNKVRRKDVPDGAADTDGWVTLDGQQLYRNAIAASAIYDRALADEMRALGYAMEDRREAGSRKMRLEVMGVSDETIAEFSGRRRQITARTQELVSEWEAEHHRDADVRTKGRLAQQATLETRASKSGPDDLEDLVRRSRSRLDQELPAASAAPVSAPVVNVEQVASDLVKELETRRSAWTAAHMETTVNLWAAGAGASTEQVAQVREQVGVASVKLTPDSTAPQIMRPVSRDVWYTSRAVMDAEATVLDGCDQLVIPSVSVEQFAQALGAHEGPLDEGQIALAHDFVVGDKLVAAGIGPAGSGKTSSMKLAVEAARHAGHRVIGLATSEAAVRVFREGTGADAAANLAAWTIHRSLHSPDEAYALNAGDIIIVDEASMASSKHLAQIVDDARSAGAYVRLIGDPNQLSAVESGGLLRTIDQRFGATRLETLWRFHDVEEGMAGLGLGDRGDVDYYLTHDRVHGVAAADVPQQVMGQWYTKRAEGLDVLVMATTNREVDALNQAAQQMLLEAGQVDHSATVALQGGALAGVGDVITTRKIDRSLRTRDGKDHVINGDDWTVRAVLPDGAVEAVKGNGKAIELPADYLRRHAHLGYATTTHRAQGRTVDEAIMVLSPTVDREALYVGLTRGRNHNQVVVPLEGRSAEQVVREVAGRVGAARSAHDLMADQQRLVDNPADAVRVYRQVVAETDRPRYDSQIRAAYRSMYGPGRELEAADDADRLISADARTALDNALRRGEDAGYSVERLLRAGHADTLSEATEPARALAWRIDRHLARGPLPDSGTRPFRELPDADLDALARRAAADKQSAAQALRDARGVARLEPAPVQLKDGTSAPSWIERPHGTLTREELSAALDDTLAAITEHTVQVRDARAELRDARRTWSQLNVDGNRLTPEAVAAAQIVEAARERYEAVQETSRMLRSEHAELRAEKQIRRTMTPRSWRQETTSRETATLRQGQPQRYTDAAEAQQHRYTSHTELETATTALDYARTFNAQVQAEVTARLRTPDQQPADRHGLPTWAGASRSLEDEGVPQGRREELVEAAVWVRHRIDARGKALATDPSRESWTRELGAVPSDPALRSRWERLAGRIDTYRQLVGYEQQDRSLPTATRGAGRQGVEIHTLRAAMSDLRRDITAQQPVVSPQPVPALVAPATIQTRAVQWETVLERYGYQRVTSEPAWAGVRSRLDQAAQRGDDVERIMSTALGEGSRRLPADHAATALWSRVAPYLTQDLADDKAWEPTPQPSREPRERSASRAQGNAPRTATERLAALHARLTAPRHDNEAAPQPHEVERGDERAPER